MATKLQLRAHALYLYTHYKQSGKGAADTLYSRLIKSEKLTGEEAYTLYDEFWKLATGAVKSNPVPLSSAAQRKKAENLYRNFTGHDASDVSVVDKPAMPDVMSVIGEIDGIMYSTVRDGKHEKYVHQFSKKSRPLFAVSPDGKMIYMLGGAYKFGDRGIIDK